MDRLTVDAALAAELGGPGRPVRWADVASPDIPAFVERTNAAIIPCGAIEQHGPHMSLAVDWLLAGYAADAISALTGVPTLPALPFGVSASHGNFPGTIGVRPETFVALVSDLVDDLYRWGVRQFVLLNGHAWNQAPLEIIADKLRTRYDDARTRALSAFDSYPHGEFDDHCDHGRMLMHASYLETSCMIYVAPELVQLERAPLHQDWPSFWDYRADQVTDNGVWGRDVPDANREVGERMMERSIETTARAIREGIDEPFGRPSANWFGGRQVPADESSRAG